MGRRRLSFFHLLSILFLLFLLLSSQHFKLAESEPFEDEEEEDDEEYVLDSHFSTSGIRGSRFLASSVPTTIKRGARCQNVTNSICNGVRVPANGGTRFLYCCKKHCRDILGDRSNCGHCGKWCVHDQRCCGGVCTNIFNSTGNCGKCNRKCPSGIPCEMGQCGYA